MNTARLVKEKLLAANWTITFMESCTSGLLASLLTDNEGASAVFRGSIVTYSNEAKEAAEDYGVYSPECAREMAAAAQEAYCAEVAVAITGTTGNVDPNNGDSVEGEACYCIIIGGDIYDYRIKADVRGMTRREIKEYYARDVYDKLSALL